MKCYMCNNESSTREHVPPACFFPSRHQVNLITVPSCPIHNLRKSKDDEYIHSIIAPCLGNNSFGQESVTKVNRSFEHSGGLVAAIFKETNIIKLSNGAETATVKVNLDRWNDFFEHFSNAIYFEDFKVAHRQRWEIINPSLSVGESLMRGQLDTCGKVNKRLLSLDFVEQETSNPEIFRYFFFRHSPESYAYKFLFYDGFIVCARSTSSGHAFA